MVTLQRRGREVRIGRDALPLAAYVLFASILTNSATPHSGSYPGLNRISFLLSEVHELRFGAQLQRLPKGGQVFGTGPAAATGEAATGIQPGAEVLSESLRRT